LRKGALATKQSILSLRGEMDCFASLAMTVSGRARHTSNRRRPPPGRRIAPPDDRLRRAIQYSETSVMESKSRSVLDTPACAGYDGLVWEHRRRHCEERSDEAIHSFFARRDGLRRGAGHRARIRATRWLAMTISTLLVCLLFEN
jgi:hypothetical protein